MKKFENPSIEIEQIQVEDVITTSNDGCPGYKCDDFGDF